MINEYPVWRDSNFPEREDTEEPQWGGGMEEHPRSLTIGDLLRAARDAGRQGHIILSKDDVKKRTLGFLDVDAGVRYWVALTTVIGRECSRPGEPESWVDTLRSIGTRGDWQRGGYSDLIRTPVGRQELARRLSGRSVN